MICSSKILFTGFMTVFAFKKCRSPFKDLSLFKEEIVLRDPPWDSTATKFHPQLRRQRIWMGRCGLLLPTDAWGCLLDDHTKRLPGPFREEALTVSSCDHLYWNLWKPSGGIIDVCFNFWGRLRILILWNYLNSPLRVIDIPWVGKNCFIIHPSWEDK